MRWIILGTLLTMACFAGVAAAFGGDIGEGSDWSVATANLAILPIALGIAAGVVRPGGLDVDRALHLTVTGWVAVPVLAATYAVPSTLLGGWWGAAAVGAAAWPVGLLGRRVADWVVYRGRPDATAATGRMLARLGERETPRRCRRSCSTRQSTRCTSTPGGSPAPGSSRSSEMRLSTAQLPGDLPRRGTSGAPAVAPAGRVGLHRARPPGPRRARRPRGAGTARCPHPHRAAGVAGAAGFGTRRGAPPAPPRAPRQPRSGPVRPLPVRCRPGPAHPPAGGHGTPSRHPGRRHIRPARSPTSSGHPSSTTTAWSPRSSTAPRTATSSTSRSPRQSRSCFPAAVDLAALRIVSEAVANTRKHAEANRVAVDLAILDGRLELSVSDDGHGLPADVRPGIGMHSITERAAELGGIARYDRAASGCRLLVTLPLGCPGRIDMSRIVVVDDHPYSAKG